MSEENSVKRSVVADPPLPGLTHAWWAVAVLLLLSAMSVLDRQVLFLMVDRIKGDLHINDFQFSLVQGISFALFYAVFGLPFGWAADHFSRRWIIFAGVTIWSLATAACGLANTFWQLFFARFGVGIGEAALSPAAFSLLSDTFPKHRVTMAIAVFASGITIGSALALGLGGVIVGLMPEAGATLPVVGHLADWQLVFLIVGIPCLAVGWLIFTLAEPARRDRLSQARTTLRDTAAFMRGHARFYSGHFLGYGFYVLCASGALFWAPTYLHRAFGWKMIVAAPALAVTMAGMSTIGAILQGVVVDRWFRSGCHDAHLRLFIIMAMIQPILLVIAVAAHNPYVFLGVIAVHSLGGPVTGISASALQLVTPNEFRGQVSAAFLLVFTLLGIGAGSTVVATFTTHIFKNDLMVGWSIVATSLIFLPIAALFLNWARKPMREALSGTYQPQPAQAPII